MLQDFLHKKMSSKRYFSKFPIYFTTMILMDATKNVIAFQKTIRLLHVHSKIKQEEEQHKLKITGQSKICKNNCFGLASSKSALEIKQICNFYLLSEEVTATEICFKLEWKQKNWKKSKKIWWAEM